MEALYSRPRQLASELVSKLGPFYLRWYWGPAASIKGSRWICQATIHVWENYGLDFLFTYLPQLDYTLQQFGPSSPQVLIDLGKIDELIGELWAAVKKRHGVMVVLSEYTMEQVSGAVFINQALRRTNLLEVREVNDMEYLDPGASRAFAVVDHQIAHVYVRPGMERIIASVLEEVPGIEQVLDREAQAGYRINHPRSGDLICVAESGKWFCYHWWKSPQRAPDFARVVDIHRKPGYDPLELFLDEDSKGISLETALIKGSHGRLPRSEAEQAVFISSVPPPKGTGEKLSVLEIAQFLLAIAAK
jgi:predicted AlkP superfamily pyrophosphatase or phosphodiesterase